MVTDVLATYVAKWKGSIQTAHQIWTMHNKIKIIIHKHKQMNLQHCEKKLFLLHDLFIFVLVFVELFKHFVFTVVEPEI